MEHESFENDAVAAALNRDFVSIKVDREERPDVDRVYMTFVQATTGAGGWPMSVFLTPDLQPFFGGTYFPPESRWGRPGFIELLTQLSQAWRKDRRQIVESRENQSIGRDVLPAHRCDHHVGVGRPDQHLMRPGEIEMGDPRIQREDDLQPAHDVDSLIDRCFIAAPCRG